MEFPRNDSRPRSPSWVSLALASILLGIAGVGTATISSVTIDPSFPTEEDLITITVAGWFPDACWSLSGFDCGEPVAGQISFDVNATDGWMPGIACALVIIPYEYACEYGPLAHGHYTVTVTEHHASLRDPLPDVAMLEFDVDGAIPVKETTWGCIRALYR